MEVKRNGKRLNGSRMRVLVAAACLIAVCLSLVSTPTVAYLKTESDTLVNVFTPVIVSGSFEESFVEGYIKTNVHVKNTGNTEIYVRLMLLPYWVDNTTKKPVGKAAWTPAFTPNSNWFRASDGCYYYKIPLPAGTDTEKLYNGQIELLNSEGDGTHQVLEILAQIIQCGPAVNTAWPAVYVDQNGSLAPVETEGEGGE